MSDPLSAIDSSFIADFIFGIVGAWLVRRGTVKHHWEFIYIGVALIVYPFLVHGPILTWGIGAGLCGLAYYRRNEEE